MLHLYISNGYVDFIENHQYIFRDSKSVYKKNKLN